jgi:hypothetical protein
MNKIVKTILVLMLSTTAVSMFAACEKTPGPQSELQPGPDLYTDANKIPYGSALEDEFGLEGAAGVEREADVKESPYFKHLDFYNMTNTETLTILTHYKTVQQATEWTCGPAAALTVLEWFGVRVDLNEQDLVALRHKPNPGATNLRQMIYIFEELNDAGLTDFNIISTYDLNEGVEGVDFDADAMRGKQNAQWSEDIPENMLLSYLEKGIPVIIGWDDWGGHWTVVIGYDTMGTDTTADDVLIVVDPYDTTDHNQDGYVIWSFERLYYNWLNSFDPQFKNNVFLIVEPN